MTALWNRAGHYIFVLWFLLSIFFFLSFFLFSLAYSQPSQIGCLLYILHMVWPKCELKCRSETCCTRLAGNAGPKITKNSPSAHHCIILSGYIFATKARIDNRKKNLNSNKSPTCPHNMVNFSPLAAEIGSLVWSALANFNGFGVLASLLQRRRSTEANQTLHDLWPSPGLVH